MLVLRFHELSSVAWIIIPKRRNIKNRKGQTIRCSIHRSNRHTFQRIGSHFILLFMSLSALFFCHIKSTQQVNGNYFVLSHFIVSTSSAFFFHVASHDKNRLNAYLIAHAMCVCISRFVWIGWFFFSSVTSKSRCSYGFVRMYNQKLRINHKLFMTETCVLVSFDRYAV